MRKSQKMVWLAAVSAGLGFAGSSFAGVVISTATAGAFPSGYTIVSPAGGDPTTPAQTNQQINANAALIQTIVPSTTFNIDKVTLLTGGMGGGSITMHIYPINVTVTGQGGGNGDGYVNTVYSTDLLGGGSGVTASVPGSGGSRLTTFDLTGTDEVQLNAGTEYGIEFDTANDGSTQFAWIRSNQDEYSNGNLYQNTSSNASGQRTQVGGSQLRDGLFAVYATAPTPEPTSLGLIGLTATALLGRRRRKAGC